MQMVRTEVRAGGEASSDVRGIVRGELLRMKTGFENVRWVWGKRETPFEGTCGRVVGTKACTLESCGGIRLGVRWPDGRLTWPCSKGLTARDSDFHDDDQIEMRIV
jgi:hypothetical protein